MTTTTGPGPGSNGSARLRPLSSTNGTARTTATDDPLLQHVQALIEDAVAAGRRTPGRPTLVRLTGAKEHRVRAALHTLATMPHPTGASTDPTGTSNNPTGGGDHADVAHRPAAPASGRLHLPRAWPLVLIALGAAVSVWSGWVGLGRLTGFGMVHLLPGIWDSLHLDSAVVLPLSVEAYGAYALRCWLGPPILSPRTRVFARRSALASLLLGALAQVVYHLLTAAGVHAAPWPVVTFVATVPVAVLGLASGLARLVANDHHQAPTATTGRLDWQ